ncbi:MAG: hypothetical protein WCI02_07145 [Planctomycetota bacterium]
MIGDLFLLEDFLGDTVSEELDRYILSLEEFLRQLKLDRVQSIHQSKTDGVHRLIVKDEWGDSLNVESWNDELTIEFSESHWHISQSDDLDSMKLECTLDVLSTLRGEVTTYSAWKSGRALGGGCCFDDSCLQRCRKSFPTAEEVRVKSFGNEREVHALDPN